MGCDNFGIFRIIAYLLEKTKLSEITRLPDYKILAEPSPLINVQLGIPISLNSGKLFEIVYVWDVLVFTILLSFLNAYPLVN